MRRYGLLTCVVVVLLMLTAVQVVADNISAASQDPTEDQALRHLTTAARLVHHNMDNEAAPMLEKLASERPDWAELPSVRLELAMAYTGKGDTAKSIAICRDLISEHKASRPTLAAWAQLCIAESRAKEGQTADAMRAYRAVDGHIANLTDLGPVLKAREKAADYFLGKTKFDPAKPDQPEILSFDSADEEAWRWARAAICARRAYCGDVEAAYPEYEQVLSSMPANDRQRAVFALHFAMNEIQGYSRRMKMDMLVHAQELIKKTEAEFPNEKWLIGKAKLAMVELMLEHSVGLPDAEKYLREVIDRAEGTNLLPQAYTWLAEVQYVQKRYDEAAATAKQAIDRYPYSSWIDFTMYLYADSLNRAGKKSEAFAALDALSAAYPQSSWAVAARASKEVFWK